MKTAEVNAAIARLKGWTEYDCYRDEKNGEPSTPDFCVEPHEWAALLEEMLGDESISVVIASRAFEVGWTRNGVRELFGGDLNITATATGEAVCRAWLAWKESPK